MNAATRHRCSPKNSVIRVPYPILFLFVGIIVAVALSPAAQAATFYLSPSGSDSNSGTSPASPWKTFASAIPKLQPGDTLLLGDGTYTSLNSGYLTAVCGGNATNGTPAKPITVRAMNERKAFLDGNGTDRPVFISGCSNWVLEGLRAKSGDYISETGEEMGSVFVIQKCSNITLRRSLGQKPNRYFNAHVYSVTAATNVLLEENEAYDFHRHGISVYVSSFVTLRRNYINPRIYPALSGYNFGPQEALSIYLSNNSIIENNVIEGSNLGNSGSFNRFFGNVALNTAVGFALGHHCCVGTSSTDNLYVNNVAVSNTSGFVSQSESKAVYLNNTALNNHRTGFVANNKYSYPNGPSWTVNPNISVQNGLSVGNGESGFFFADTSQFSALTLDHLNAFGNTVDYSTGTGNRTNSGSVNPGLGSCKVFLPANSALKGAGANGADIGANILYRYIDGTLTDQPLWDSWTGTFACGATVAGVNDAPLFSCYDVNQRLNVNTNGCALPAGYGQNSTNPPSNPGLVAAFGFSEGIGTTTADASGNANNGTISGATWTNAGKFGSALSFNGSNSYVTAGTSKLPAANAPQTISWWMNFPYIPPAPQSIIVLSNPAQGSSVQPGLKNSLVAVWQYGGTVLVSATPPSANAWHHYAYTFDGSTHRFYIDGIQVGSSSLAPKTGAVTNLEFGRWGGGNSECYRGLLDEVRIYSRVLSQTEIQTDMNTPVVAPPAGDTVPPVISNVSASAVAQNSATITWTTDEASDSQVDYGTTTVYGSSTPLNPSLVTTHSRDLTGLAAGTLYHFRVKSRDAAGNLATSGDFTFTTTAPPDATLPTITITSPPSGATYGTTASTVNIAGTASDNVGVTQVTWANDRGGAGIASGTTAWSVTGITLQSGSNVITVTARDAAGNSGAAMLAVTYTPPDPTPPTVRVTSPTSSTTYSATASPLNIAGTASDNVGVTQVTWSNDRGGSGTASGTTNWSVSGISLQSGSNVITVTARDAAGNSGIAALTVTFTTIPNQANLVAAYSFNENAGTLVSDSSGNLNTGTIFGATWTPAGKFGSALSFDGVTSRVSVPGGRMPAPNTPHTVSGWLYLPSSPPRDQTVITITAPAARSGIQFGFNTSQVGVWKYGGTPLVSAALPAANTWNYYAYTFDGSEHRLYINGVLASGSNEPPQTASPAMLEFGRWPEGNNEYFRGLIDEVRIYNKALSPIEIQSDMNTPVGSTPAIDTIPPIISNTSVSSVTATSAAVSWVTDETSDSQVEYGLTTAYGSATSLNPSLVTSHAQGLTGLASGTLYHFRVKSRDAAGNLATSGDFTLTTTVLPDTTPPTAAITSPLTGSVLAGTVLVTASALDNVGVAGVQFLLNGVSLGSEVTTGPYSVSWDTTAVSNGTYTLSALGRDAAGNTARAADIFVTVANTALNPGGLVAAFGLDEGTGSTIADASGNSNTGSISGATWTSGAFGNALSFNGINSYVTAGVSKLPAANAPQTISWWMNFPSVPASPQSVIALSNPAQGSAVQPGFANSRVAVWQFGGAVLVSAPPPSANAWHHYAYTFDGTTHRLYIDGILVNSSNLPPKTGAVTNLEFGRWIGNSEYFRGLLDEVRIYSRTLSQAEIQSVMNTPLGSSGLMAAFGFDEGAGATVADASGNSNTGSISGATWTSGAFGNALSFNGINSYVTAGVSKLPAANAPQTISWWMNFPSVPTSPQSVIALSNPAQGSAVQPGFANSRVAVWQFGGTVLVSAPPPSANAWHHYAYTYDGSTHRLYIDGILVNSSNLPPKTGAVTNLEFGRWTGNSEYFRGLLDEVRIYSRTLGQAEIQSVMNTPVSALLSAGLWIISVRPALC